MKKKIAENNLTLVSTTSNVSEETRGNKIIKSKIPLPSKGVTIGKLIAIENSRPVIHYSGCPNDKGLIAQTIEYVTIDKIGKPVLLSFVNDNPECPVIIGFLIQQYDGNTKSTNPVNVEIDGECLLLSADREIVLRCGEASLTLTHAGKVLIKGAYVVSRSTGYNKIKGAAVDIN